MKLEQIGVSEMQEISNLSANELLLMVLKRLERMERKIDQKIEDAIRERLELKNDPR